MVQRDLPSKYKIIEVKWHNLRPFEAQAVKKFRTIVTIKGHAPYC